MNTSRKLTSLKYVLAICTILFSFLGVGATQIQRRCIWLNSSSGMMGRKSATGCTFTIDTHRMRYGSSFVPVVAPSLNTAHLATNNVCKCVFLVKHKVSQSYNLFGNEFHIIHIAYFSIVDPIPDNLEIGRLQPWIIQDQHDPPVIHYFNVPLHRGPPKY